MNKLDLYLVFTKIGTVNNVDFLFCYSGKASAIKTRNLSLALIKHLNKKCIILCKDERGVKYVFESSQFGPKRIIEFFNILRDSIKKREYNMFPMYLVSCTERVKNYSRKLHGEAFEALMLAINL